jgi:methionyl-tRNA formyltransferase
VASIDFEKPIRDVYNLIRGCDPQPGAFVTFKGKRVRLYDVRMTPSDLEKRPGEIVLIEREEIKIAAKGGSLKVGKLRLDKGEKIGPIEFAQSVDAKVGDRFGE